MSRLCGEIDGKVKAFLERPIDGDWPYLWIDATYLKVRRGGRIVSVAVIIAVGVNADGRREVLGMEIGTSEAEPIWTECPPSGPMGVKSIAEYLNTRGYRTRRGNLWHVGPLHGLLRNTVYRGEYTYNAVDSNTRIKRPKEDHVAVAYPAIIDPRRFEAVQASLRSRNPKLSAPRVVTGPILLTGLLQCAKCGGAMTMRTGKSGRYTYYACASRQTRGTAACEGCSHPMRHADEAVTEALVSEALTPPRLDGILRRIESDRRADDENSAEQLRMQAELANARQRINRLMTMVEQGLVEASDPELAVKLTAAQKDRDIATAGIERVRRRIGPALELEPERIVAFSNYMKDRVRNGDIPFRKAYIRSIIDHIVVGDKQAKLSGRRDGLLALVATHNEGGEAVPTGIQEWRTRQDETGHWTLEVAL